MRINRNRLKRHNTIAYELASGVSRATASTILFLSIVAPVLAQTTFTDVTTATGIAVSDNQNTLSYGNPIWGDFNNDGYLDIYVDNHGNPPNLFRNNGNGTFTDIQKSSGIPVLPLPAGDRHGAAWGDYLGNGLLDLYIAVGGDQGHPPPNKTDQLYQNNGNNTFTDVTAAAGVQNAVGRGRSPNWVDFNNDGLLDLYVQNASTANVLYQNNGNGTFTNVATAAGVASISGSIASFVDYNNDGCMDLLVVGPGTSDQLWKNNCNGTFTNVTSAAGIKNKTSGYGIAWGDYNNDGYIDLYISRGTDDRRAFAWNSGSINLSDQETGAQGGLDFTTTATQVTFDAYVKNCRSPSETFYGAANSTPASIPFTLTAQQAAGTPTYTAGTSLGFFIWNDASGWHIRESAPKVQTADNFYAIVSGNGTFQSVTGSNLPAEPKLSSGTLYRNNGNGTFTDVTTSAGLAAPVTNNRGAVWGDYDDDGYLDLFVVNSGSILDGGVNHLYHNNGDGTFTDLAASAGLGIVVNGRGDGAAWGDFNNDGFPDLYVVNGADTPVPVVGGGSSCVDHGPHVLYQNNGNSNHWLKLNLIGVESNRSGVGARVTLQAGSLTQFREVNGNGGGGASFSQGAPGPIHFGLGQATMADSITIQWPSGISQTLNNVSANQTLQVTEP